MQKPKIILINVLLFSLTGLAALFLVPVEAIMHGIDWKEWLAFVLLAGYAGMSITAGYHRLWSHKAYQAHPAIRFIFALGGALALQNSALHWSSDHRVHHKHVDDIDKDPYSIRRGFWFAHIGWMLREYQANRYSDYANCRDLQKDAIVMWQHKYYLPLVIVMNIGLPVVLGWLNGDVWGMFLMAGVLRLVFSHHVTFLINSAAHMWGKRTYTEDNTARDNGVLALFTYGEGYHNFHHKFEYDYRNGIQWWHYDPTKWLIAVLAKMGLATGLRRCPQEKIEQAIASMQLKQYEQQLSQLPNADELLARLHAEYDALIERIGAYYDTRKRLLEIKRKQLLRAYDKFDLDMHYRELKMQLQVQRYKWAQFGKLTCV